MSGTPSLGITGKGAVVSVSGDIDHRTAPLLGRDLAARSDDLELDLANVTFIDSSGLRVLVQVQLAARHRGNTVVVIAASPLVARVLTITGLVDQLSPDRSAAFGAGS